MPTVSVIIPVYNAEKYLEECLNSLVSQTLQEIEKIDELEKDVLIKHYGLFSNKNYTLYLTNLYIYSQYLYHCHCG